MRMTVSNLRLPRPRSAHLLAGIFLLILIALVATGCIGGTDTPQNTLAPEGEVARHQRNLFMLAMWPALVVMILVEGAIIVTLLRFRRRKNDAVPKQTHGNTPLEIGWTIVPTLIIIGFVGVPMLPVLFDLGRDPKADAYPIEVTGQRFQWSFKYPNIKDGRTGEPLESPPVTPGRAAELHIPAGKEIALTLTSIDVNHSFGVPRLAGTQDAIAGEHHRFWMKADHPGSFSGQCRELCGVDHWGMLITVIAQSQEDFDAWAKEAAAGVKQTPEGRVPSAVAATGSGD